MSAPAGTAALLRELLRLQAAGTWLPVVVLVAVSLTDGLALCLLMPLLSLVGVDVGAGASGRIAHEVLAVMAAVGLPRSLPVVLPAFVLLVGSRSLLARWQSRMHNRRQLETVATLRTRLYAALGHASWARVSSVAHSRLAHALTFECDRVGYAAWGLLQAAAGVVVLAVYAGLALRVSPALTGIAAAGVAVVGALLHRRLKTARWLGEELGRITRGLYAEVMSHLTGMKAARSYGAWDRSRRVFGSLTEQTTSLHHRMVTLNADVRCGLEIGAAVVLVVVLVSSQRLGVAVGAVLFLAYLFYRTLPLLSNLQLAWQHLAGNLPALRDLLELQRELEAGTEPAPAAELEVELGDGVRLEAVSYRHPGAGDRIGLDAIDLAVPRGALVAVVGASGAGKTTLADLVLGLLRPDAGRVLVGGVPLDESRLRSWRARVGYVPQETFLFAGTVRDNLAWACPAATDEELRTALRQAAADFLDQLPDGLDTVLGDVGVGLSGGERQRLSLARALLRRPELIVLDEGTGALDPENARRILDTLRGLRGQTTVLVFSHEPVPGADHTFALDGGRLAPRAPRLAAAAAAAAAAAEGGHA